ncbi:hypothetical protein V7S79_09145 [Aquirufa sp. ROCK-SH2]
MKTNKKVNLPTSLFYLFLSLASLYHIISHFSEYFNDPSFKDLFAAFLVVPLLFYVGISDVIKFIRLKRKP